MIIINIYIVLIHKSALSALKLQVTTKSIVSLGRLLSIGYCYPSLGFILLCFIFTGKQEAVEATLEALKVVPQPLGKWASILVEICAYAGTGNVLKIQKLLHICSEHFEHKESEEKEKEKSKDSKDKDKKEEEKEDDGSHQGIAVLGIALIAMAEDIGSQMALRAYNHLVKILYFISAA